MRKFRTLEKQIGYRFKKKALLDAALTHPSYRYENSDVESDNQRLEFLGDSVLGFLAADTLTKLHEEAAEGDLTMKKSALTSGSYLAKAAMKIDLGAHLLLGRGESSAGGAERESNLEDVLEALMGAIWLDGGLKAARRFFDRHIFQAVESAPPALLNPKGTLQEYTQKSGYGIPFYEVLKVSGPDHDRQFEVQVTVGAFVFQGVGRNRRSAEKIAASLAVKSMVS